MNRKGIKYASRLSVQDAKPEPYIFTLVYLLVSVASFCLISLCEDHAMQTLTMQQSDSHFISGYGSSSNVSLLLLADLALEFFVFILSFGYKASVLWMSRKQKASVSSLFCGFRHLGKVLWLSILIGIFTFLWSCLLIIPGVIAAYRYRFAYYILAEDPGLTARQALRISCRMTQGHKSELFFLDLSFIPLHLLCCLTAGILYIWKLPYIEAASAHVYNHVVSMQDCSGQEPQ